MSAGYFPEVRAMESAITDIMHNWKIEAGVTSEILYNIKWGSQKIVICTKYPGWLIGKAGTLIDKYSEKLASYLLWNNLHIELVDCMYSV